MEDIVVTASTDSVVAISATTNIISITDIEPVLVNSMNGNIITVGTESAVLVERPNSTLLVTGILGPPGPSGISEDDIVYSKRIDFISENELYKGEAVVGAGESSNLWRIRKIVITNDGDITETWASGNAYFDKSWSNRAALSYS